MPAGEPAASTASAPRGRTIDADAERRLLAQWRRGERDLAFRALMSLYGRGLLGFARRMVRDEDAAQDVRQQVFLEAWRGLDRYEGRASLWTWLCAIAHNRCLDAARRGGRINAREVAVDLDVLESVAPAPEQAMTSDRLAERRALEHCLRRLPVAVRAQVLMRYDQGLSHAEIAEIIGDAPGTVQVRLARALPKLRRCLESQGASR